VLKVLANKKKDNRIKARQVSFILSESFVITFSDRNKDYFHFIAERIASGRGNIRSMGADYLLYALLDVIIDNYFILLESFAEQLEKLENSLLNNPSSDTLKSIYGFKRDIIVLTRSIWPLRELIKKIERHEDSFVQKSTIVYIRDLYDHVIQVINTVESYREILSGMLDIYLSSISNKLNAVMKVLTIISTIFIPLTFIAGVYGMNFSFMPELKWKYGYFAALSGMALISLGMIYYFKRKKWM
jgi:magnesium transporter